jgi:hypothetical protein
MPGAFPGTGYSLNYQGGFSSSTRGPPSPREESTPELSPAHMDYHSTRSSPDRMDTLSLPLSNEVGFGFGTQNPDYDEPVVDVKLDDELDTLDRGAEEA